MLERLRAVDERLTMLLLQSALPRKLSWVLLRLVGLQPLVLVLLLVRMLLGRWGLSPCSGLWSTRGVPRGGVRGLELGMGRLWRSSVGPVPDAMV